MFKYRITVNQTGKQTRICIPRALAEMTGLDKATMATIESGKDGTLYLREWKDDPKQKRDLQTN